MIRTIFFDMGGTLDGEGHWLERFLALYKSFGLARPREEIRRAFDEAERKSSTDEGMASSNFATMIALHVKWQLAHLGLTDSALEQHLVRGFLTPARAAAAENARLLATLAQRGFTLGVISNGCGNVAQLCAEFGYTPFLTLVVDSRRVGLSKPDPAVYEYAAAKISGDPGTMLMIGDSFERDVRPAKKIGMKTVWLEGVNPHESPDPSLIDLRLRHLADLPAALSPAFV